MTQSLFRYGTPLSALCCLLLTVLILTNRELPNDLAVLLQNSQVQTFKELFLGILLEAFPFILLGVIFSALLQVFVSDDTIRKFTPRNRYAGVLFGGLIGILFPLCECGMIPVIRRLIRKGMPAYIGVVYLLAGPIVNPIVFASTITAFREAPEMAYTRMALGFAVAVAIGYAFSRKMDWNPLRVASAPPSSAFHIVTPSVGGTPPATNKWTSTLTHASDEFFDMGKYFILGALLTALIQTSVERDILLSFADQPLLSYLFMLGFAFVLSICSTSDAFIASSFQGVFQPGPLLAFLVFGPMMDFKSMLMMISAFKVKFVLIVMIAAFALTLAGSWLAGVLL
ncbi:permease [Paenibacillus sp. GCM10027627]|uniref:permease n=1 Tax=unclassified Paenibacillus TaxID=185978 RepID=UPI00363E259F